jgi:hypothetical protein
MSSMNARVSGIMKQLVPGCLIAYPIASSRMARTVARPAASRDTVAGARGGGGPSITGPPGLTACPGNASSAHTDPGLTASITEMMTIIRRGHNAGRC